MEEMTAYELAGLIELAPSYIQYREEAAIMLRKQQEKIEELELQLSVESYLHKKLATS